MESIVDSFCILAKDSGTIRHNGRRKTEVWDNSVLWDLLASCEECIRYSRHILSYIDFMYYLSSCSCEVAMFLKEYRSSNSFLILSICCIL